MSGDHNMNQTSAAWRKRQIALDKKAENARELGLDYEPDKTNKGTSMTDQQKVWKALRAIYGMDLTAATLVVLTKDGKTAVKFQTIYFPQQETKK